MSWKHKLVVLLLTANCLIDASAAFSSEAKSIKFVDHRLSVDFRDTLAATVFAELEMTAGIRIRVPKPVSSRTLTIAFADASIEDAVRQVFRALSVANYAVISPPDGKERTTFVVLDSLDVHDPLINIREAATETRLARIDDSKLSATDSAEPDIVSISDSFVSGTIVEDIPTVALGPGTGLAVNE